MNKEIKVNSYIKENERWKDISTLPEEEKKEILKKINHNFMQSMGYLSKRI